MKPRTRRTDRKPTDHEAGPPHAFPIIGVGVSAGGLEAFTELFRRLPRDPGAAFVVIQHLDPTHGSHLREALAHATVLPVTDVHDGAPIEPDHVYVMPPNADVGILHGTLRLVPRPSEARALHLPIDFFFAALAADQGGRAIGVVLSGTGADGTEGLRALKAAGGITFAQDPRSAAHAGMPEAAVRAGVVDFALPIPALAEKLLEIVAHPYLSASPDGALVESRGDDMAFGQVLMLLRGAVGVDVSEYKPVSIRRRLARRMALHRLTSLPDYVQLLRDDKAEVEALFEDVLIHVTSFFRDPEAFAALTAHVFPAILEQKRRGGAIRIWCAGCSTGEEAYSLMIALHEFLEREGALDVPVQLFATDISEKSIDVARAGLYDDHSVRDLAPERLARHFTRAQRGYRINKAIRERCAFVRHDVARDPPFSKLDLVSCRNLLIYFGAELQQRVIAAFHFALNVPGFLLLGRAEGVGDRSNLFSVVDKEARLFARVLGPSSLRFAPSRESPLVARAPEEPSRRASPMDTLLRKAEARLLELYVPPGVIVNERLEVLQFRGRTAPFLEPPAGEPHYDLLAMAPPGLVAPLRIAVSQAHKDGTTVRRPGVRLDVSGVTRVCDVVAIPLTAPPQSRERLFAVLFEEQRAEAGAEAGPALAQAPDAGERQRVAALETDLEATNAYLQSLLDEHRRTNDDLISANEELVSSNEELQSLNEELETAKEELQSTNEELSTLNEEMQSRNADLDAANSDLLNILGSVEVPIVIVDARRRIRRFTPKARPILNLLPTDVGRPIDDIKPILVIEDLDRQIAEVIDTVVAREIEARDRDGRWYRLQIRPYTTVDKRIDGAVISLVDIDALKRALGAAEWTRDYARATVEAVRTPLVVLNAHHEVVLANRAFREHYGTPIAELEGRSLYALLGGAWAIEPVRAAMQRLFDRGEVFDDLAVERRIAGLGLRIVSMSGRIVATPSGERLALLSTEDVTDRHRDEAARTRLLADERAAKAAADAANRAKDQFLATLSHELRTPLSTLVMYADLLSNAKMDPAAVRNAGAGIARAAKSQARLIDDLLDISRIVTGKLRMEQQRVSLAAVVRGAIEVVQPSITGKKLELQLAIDEAVPPVAGDPARLQQVVTNLLTNAVKFTPAGGHIRVTVDVAGGQARLVVQDTGTGIEASFLPHVFQRFSQEDREQTRAYGGLGLGLGIVRYLVEAHGGTVEAHSAGKGHGATFTVRLPLLDAGAAASVDAAPVAAADSMERLDGVRVLIVEDDPGTREALTDGLRSVGADVHAVDSAAAAMQAFEGLRPDLLVCDIAMPGEDGYQLLGRIRGLGPARGGAVPALALTALASDEDRRRAAEAGFDLHLAKPVDRSRLVAALARLRARR